MKYRLVIDCDRDEEIIIYTHEKTNFINELCDFIDERVREITAYDDRGIKNLQISEIYAFIIEDQKLCALTKDGKYRLRARLYQIEESVGDSFVKINQSCIINIKYIERFDTTIYGVLMVNMKNGYRDYVSRRQLKSVKERINKKI